MDFVQALLGALGGSLPNRRCHRRRGRVWDAVDFPAHSYKLELAKNHVKKTIAYQR